MAQLVVRNLDEDVKEGLRRRAKGHGRSLEAEVRDILRAAVLPAEAAGLGSRIIALFRDIPMSEMEDVREPSRPLLDFSGPEYGRDEEDPAE